MRLGSHLQPLRNPPPRHPAFPPQTQADSYGLPEEIKTRAQTRRPMRRLARGQAEGPERGGCAPKRLLSTV
jgi:hypothetical protein